LFNSHQPTNTDGTKATRATRRAGIAAAILSLGMAALPLAMAPAANAATSGRLGPCTVTAEKPYFTGTHTLSGKKLIAYPISATCNRGNVDVIMKQIIQEDDWSTPNDVQKDWYIPTQNRKPLHFSAPGTKKVAPVPVYRLTSSWDDFGTAEEVFHRVKFWVSSNGVTQGPITVTSRNTSIHA
jgi:hypothetical protein